MMHGNVHATRDFFHVDSVRHCVRPNLQHLDLRGLTVQIQEAAQKAKKLRPFREESVEFDRTKKLFIEGDAWIH